MHLQCLVGEKRETRAKTGVDSIIEKKIIRKIDGVLGRVQISKGFRPVIQVTSVTLTARLMELLTIYSLITQKKLVLLIIEGPQAFRSSWHFFLLGTNELGLLIL